MTGFNVQISTMDDALKVSNMLSKSNLIPKEFKDKPDEIFIAGMFGAKLGLDIFESLSSIAVINGRTTLWGDGLLAICQPYMEYINETFDESTATAYCEVMRKGWKKPVVKSFSWQDAVTAKLDKKGGAWSAYPRIMLEKRARAFALRTAFADKLHGVYSREEVTNTINPDEIITAEKKSDIASLPNVKSKGNNILDALKKSNEELSEEVVVNGQ